mmetsp:Transcript_18405/g.22847  ORF Transcript_18405/g.22847 Transcript_18405/m.22847 type:complete len:200 (+) Transcript_18405:190-789(+)
MAMRSREQIHGERDVVVPASLPWVNSYTPSSSATRTVKRGPYCATSAVSWSRPVAPIKPVAAFQTPIIVPTAQLLSTMEEPSRGSQQTVYSVAGAVPPPPPPGVGRTTGSSSEAASRIAEDLWAASQRSLSAMTSTLKSVSPKVLLLPSTVTSAVRNAVEMETHAAIKSLITVFKLSLLHFSRNMSSRELYVSFFSTFV